jgi:hypothetical protein
MHLHSAGIIIYHFLSYVTFGAVVYHLIRKNSLSYWFLLALAITAGLAMELVNDLILPENLVIYPRPHIFTIPGTEVPLSIVIGWGWASVITRLVNDRIGRALIRTKSTLLSQIFQTILLIPVAFLAGFFFEFLGTIPGVWIYPKHEGMLAFPVWISGPSTYAFMIPLANAIAETLSFGIRRFVPS